MPGRRLDGWKEISSYLQCGVKTAQKLEKEDGLPVHRLPLPEGRPGGPSPVFAFTGELDRWRAGRQAAAARQAEGGLAAAGHGLDAASPAAGESPGAGGGRLRAALRSRLAVRLALAVGLILAVYGSVSWYFRLSRGNHLMRSARLEGDAVAGYSGDGQVLWRVELGGSSLSSHDHVVLPLRFGDFNGDGAEEVLVAQRLAGRGTGEQAALLCLDSGGRELWRFYADQVPSMKNAAGRFHVWEYSTAARLPGGKKGIVVLIQREDLPSSSLAIVDANGVLRADYVLSGKAYAHAITDLDRDGANEVVVGGLDEAAQAPFMAVLRCGCLESPSAGAGTGCRETVHCSPGRTEVSKALDLSDAVTRIQNVSEDRLSANVTILSTPHMAERSYLFDRNLQKFHLTIPQTYTARQRELFQQGKMDHDYSEKDRQELIRDFRLEVQK